MGDALSRFERLINDPRVTKGLKEKRKLQRERRMDEIEKGLGFKFPGREPMTTPLLGAPKSGEDLGGLNQESLFHLAISSGTDPKTAEEATKILEQKIWGMTVSDSVKCETSERLHAFIHTGGVRDEVKAIAFEALKEREDSVDQMYSLVVSDSVPEELRLQALGVLREKGDWKTLMKLRVEMPQVLDFDSGKMAAVWENGEVCGAAMSAKTNRTLLDALNILEVRGEEKLMRMLATVRPGASELILSKTEEKGNGVTALPAMAGSTLHDMAMLPDVPHEQKVSILRELVNIGDEKFVGHMVMEDPSLIDTSPEGLAKASDAELYGFVMSNWTLIARVKGLEILSERGRKDIVEEAERKRPELRKVLEKPKEPAPPDQFSDTTAASGESERISEGETEKAIGFEMGDDKTGVSDEPQRIARKEKKGEDNGVFDAGGEDEYQLPYGETPELYFVDLIKELRVDLGSNRETAKREGVTSKDDALDAVLKFYDLDYDKLEIMKKIHLLERVISDLKRGNFEARFKLMLKIRKLRFAGQPKEETEALRDIAQSIMSNDFSGKDLKRVKKICSQWGLQTEDKKVANAVLDVFEAMDIEHLDKGDGLMFSEIIKGFRWGTRKRAQTLLGLIENERVPGGEEVPSEEEWYEGFALIEKIAPVLEENQRAQELMRNDNFGIQPIDGADAILRFIDPNYEKRPESFVQSFIEKVNEYLGEDIMFRLPLVFASYNLSRGGEEMRHRSCEYLIGILSNKQTRGRVKQEDLYKLEMGVRIATATTQTGEMQGRILTLSNIVKQQLKSLE